MGGGGVHGTARLITLTVIFTIIAEALIFMVILWAFDAGQKYAKREAKKECRDPADR